MGKMFGNLTSTDNLEATTDRLGGGNFDPVPSGVYDATIMLAYVGQSQRSKSQSITIHADVGGKEVRETLWITTGEGLNYYPDKQDPNKKIPMASFVTVDDLCLLTTGLGLIEQDTEEKVVKIYNSAEQKEVPTPVQCLTGLHGQKVKLGILREIVDKQKKNPAGVYENTGETKTQNSIDKVFHPETGRTVNEYRQEVQAAEFMDAWSKKNTGNDRMKAKGATGNGGAGGGGMGHPGAANADATPRKALFGK
jgi:hypothetical protein